MKTPILSLMISALLTLGPILNVHAQPQNEQLHLDAVTRIRDEGLNRSQIMKTITHITDNIGPRLSGSPSLREANEWTRDQFTELGLNARLEGFDFGKGWTFDHVSVHMTAPRNIPLLAYPRAWTPGTDGAVRGIVERVTLEKEADLEKHRGNLAGKILLMDSSREIAEGDRSMVQRHDDHSLEAVVDFPIPSERTPAEGMNAVERFLFREKLHAYLVEQGVVATLYISSWDYGIIRLGAGAAHEVAAQPGVPSLQMGAEHYNLLSRLAADEQSVELEIRVDAQFHENDLQAYNTIADLPGQGRLADEIVMAGAHLDSWHAGAGATDNASGVAIVMEALRILKAIGVEPRRTIRAALWSGEEQGLLGSRAYVARHIATRPAATDEEQLWVPERIRDLTWPVQTLPGHAKHIAYFNFDNGTGKIRGVHAQQNVASKPIFEAWLYPLHDLGADTVALRSVGSTDHIPFDGVGVPGFQFIQDRLDYSTRTHHSHLDTLDYVRREDLMQAAVVMATFLYHAAMRDEPFPRKPVPEKPPADPAEEKAKQAWKELNEAVTPVTQ
jgi:carboxypeptidase Q